LPNSTITLRKIGLALYPQSQISKFMAIIPDPSAIKSPFSTPHHQPDSYLIMVVDDISQNLHLLDHILNKVGYNTTFCTDGEQALERLKVT
jgi:PleD family two-component response regulator